MLEEMLTPGTSRAGQREGSECPAETQQTHFSRVVLVSGVQHKHVLCCVREATVTGEKNGSFHTAVAWA